ncbi:dienelactone hydrolase family protein [Thalassomonas actiniarum]|uniref:Dienelactone hydrolase family protein n=1 Tax=Thalassomonas actiniarum TaxID=485447 RepID=A0AAE9YNN3_9GAMM|nr:dienelactone hydrolase family protein [Thalassomonas actiniarum]WDD97663.1 dienelactone hydrolase family protein [Thalassomonas actiniarum]
MQTFIITDIFGVTDKLFAYRQQLERCGCRVQIIDPYQGEKQEFTSEQIAYQRFNLDCGFEAYVSQISAALADSSREKVILGFSVGAAAAYKALDKLSPGCAQEMVVRHLIGFYPGQIRHHLDINPRCPVTLVFPRNEQHFALDKVISCLTEKPRVCCIRTPFAHGFMNPLSVNYHQAAANHYFGQLSGENMRLPPQALQHILLPKQITQTL